jgi:uncharacterized protein (DUF1697 family)
MVVAGSSRRRERGLSELARYIALLRAINVGGRVVDMATIRSLFESIKLRRVESFIASGNIIFESDESPEELEPRIEARLFDSLGYRVEVFLRTDAEIAGIAGTRPFSAEEFEHSPTFVVIFHRDRLSPMDVAKVEALRSDLMSFHVGGREVYLLSRLRQSDPEFGKRSTDRTMKQPTTARGMNTIVRLAAKYPPATESRPQRGIEKKPNSARRRPKGRSG